MRRGQPVAAGISAIHEGTQVRASFDPASNRADKIEVMGKAKKSGRHSKTNSASGGSSMNGSSGSVSGTSDTNNTAGTGTDQMNSKSNTGNGTPNNPNPH